MGIAVPVQAMPSQVMIIRHAEKYEDRNKIHLNPRGLTRAMALAQFFRSDPRVLEYGTVAAIIAQRPSRHKSSVRCEETVEPPARALGRTVINRFAYGEVTELAEWLRAGREWDSKSVLVCAAHMDIVPLAKALGVPHLRQLVWPHETYDRVWLIDFSQPDGKVTSFRDIPQTLLFGDSCQVASESPQLGTLRFSQTYRETSDGSAPEGVPATMWKCSIVAEVPGDFSRYDDDTIPVLRLGGFTFGYHATTLGKLRESKHAVVETRAGEGSGSVLYTYNAPVAGIEKTYARVSFSWDKERLKAEFHADVDETLVTPDLGMPVECRLERAAGTIRGVTGCFLAFGDQRFHAPIGLAYNGTATTAKSESNKQVYEISLKDENGFLVKKPNLPEM
ncbi:MAG: histidine phosphatase family protein [Pseudomonadota bacterium]